jgi:quinohemoprotein ethanol dehydrogenase
VRRDPLLRALCVVALLTPAVGAFSNPATLRDEASGADWPAYGRTYGEQHYSPLSQISPSNVKQLGLIWSLDLGQGNPATIPLAVHGVLYIAVGLSVVHAIDAASGAALWTYDPQVPKAAGSGLRQGWGSRGLAFWNGKIYTATADGRLIALDAKSGIPIWNAMTIEKNDGRYITGAPRAVDGKVIIGHGGNDSAAVRGYVTCYDAETGRMLWRFYTVPGNPASGFEDDAQKMAAQSWAGDWWKLGGGGTVWNSFAYDPATRSVFLGTGNGSPWNRRVRSADRGDNLFIASIVALDADTGRYKWHYQVNPGDSWDYDASMDLQLAELTIAGVRRQVLIQAAKNGFVYVIDRNTGALISAEKFAKVTWATKIDLTTGRPIEDPDARYPNGQAFELWPSFFGAHSWLPSAYSPKDQLLFVPVIEKGGIYNDRGISSGNWVRTPGNAVDAAVNIGLGPINDPLNDTSWLLAVAPSTQKHVWRVRTPTGANGGVMATGGGLVFQGQSTGEFDAYAARSGDKLWSYAAQSGIVAAPISYLVHGKQFVSVAVGIGTGAAFVPTARAGSVDYRTQARRLLTFAIGGRLTLPAPQGFTLSAPDDADYRTDDALALRGAIGFGRHCTNCHGSNAVSAGNAPDLRVSAIPQSAEAFARVVRDGALLEKGMPRFEEFDDQKLNAIRQFIRARSADLRDGR